MLPLDLHVLGLSLAFILSQDQTLRCRKDCWIISYQYNPVCIAPTNNQTKFPVAPQSFLKSQGCCLVFTFFFLVLHQYCQRTFFNLSPLARKLRATNLFRKAGAKISDLFAKLQIFSLKILKVFSGPNLLLSYSFPLSSLTFLETN